MRAVDHSRVAAGAFAGLLGTCLIFLAVALLYWLPQVSRETIAKATRGKPATKMEAWERTTEQTARQSLALGDAYTSEQSRVQTHEVAAGAIVGSVLSSFGTTSTKVVADVNRLFELRVAADTVVEYHDSDLVLTTESSRISVQTFARVGPDELDLSGVLAKRMGIDATSVSDYTGTEKGFVGEGTPAAYGFERGDVRIMLIQKSADLKSRGELDAIAASFRWLE